MSTSHAPRRYYLVDGSVISLRLHEPPPVGEVPEEVVQAIWKRKAFKPGPLRLSNDQGSCTILYPGRLNHGPGPDFLDARLVIDGILWNGDVEVHTRSNVWNLHGHETDDAYRAVVLHVSLFADTTTGHLRSPTGNTLPELVLAPVLTQSIRSLIHDHFGRRELPFPCFPSWKNISPETRLGLAKMLAQQRLAARSRHMRAEIQAGLPPLTVLYRRVFRCLGFGSNPDAMEQLAVLIPRRLAGSISNIEDRVSMYLTAASFDEARNGLPHEVVPLRPESWANARFRPSNAPARRIEQGVRLVSGPLDLIEHDPSSAIGDAVHQSDAGALVRLIRGSSKTDRSGIGVERARGIVRDALLPFALARGSVRKGSVMRNCVKVLEKYPIHAAGIRPYLEGSDFFETSLSGHGLRELKQSRCNSGSCLNCTIGRTILETNETQHGQTREG